jgi:hypothetical protein
MIVEVNMCSTPRPRTKVAGKSSSSASILSSMSTESRRRFTEQANIAQERRDKIKMAEKNQKKYNKASTKAIYKSVNKKASKSLSYWLVSASLREIFALLFFSRSKAN